MKKNKLVIADLLVLMITLNCAAFLNNVFLKFYEVTSIYINLAIIALIICIKKRVAYFELRRYFLLMIFITFAIFTLFITKGGVGSIIVPAYGFTLLFLLMNISLEKRHLNFIFILFLIFNLYWVINSPGYYIKFLYNKNKYINSNTIASFLMYTAMYLKVIGNHINFKKLDLLLFFDYCLTFWAILNLQSRGAAITFVLFIVLELLLPHRLLLRKNFVLGFLILLIILGTLFPAFYTYLFVNGYNITIPLFNKPFFTGRESIWFNFYSYMSQNLVSWLFGLGSKAELWIGNDLNLHNNYLAIITNFGLIGYFIYYFLVLKVVDELYNFKKISSIDTSSIILLMSILINGYVEVSTMWQVMFLFNFFFVSLFRRD